VRTIGVVTTSRADYGVYLPLLRAIEQDGDLELLLVVGGMHLSPEFGYTADAIEADGFVINQRVNMLSFSDAPDAIAKSMGLGTEGFAQAYADSTPDLLLVLGDRFEMHSAALAALPFKIPVGHIHGGEITEGAIDDALRHCITKLSHLHFAATEDYGRRIEQLGEESWRITISGAPSLDNLHSIELLNQQTLEENCGFSLEIAPLLVTYHPVTLEYEQAEWQAGQLLEALEESGFPVVFTMPNADTNGRLIHQMMKDFVKHHPRSWLVNNLGTQQYFSLMAHGSAMVGNSSSGMVEAAPFSLPVVNIGSRQKGRIRTANIIDVDYSKAEILDGIRLATSEHFREEANKVVSPYGDGHAAERIVSVLKNVELGDRLVTKRFIDHEIGVKVRA
jgi:UDP-N-acetylglucosamine 2-epimerase (non-hydrolysing)/GDP/UDP-N,N'-diacetylbacillosamine 2-epimerase (hydrolysing)